MVYFTFIGLQLYRHRFALVPFLGGGDVFFARSKITFRVAINNIQAYTEATIIKM